MALAGFDQPSRIRVAREAVWSTALPAVMATVIIGVSLQVASRLEGQSVIVAGALAALVVLPAWLVLSTNYAVSIAILLLYLGLIDGAVKLGLETPAATLGRDILLYSIVFGAVLRMLADRRPLRLPPFTGYVLAFVVIVLVQVFNPGTEGIVRGLAAARPHLEFVPLFFFGYAIMREPGRVRAYLLLLCIIGAANGVVGLIQFNLSPEQLASWGPGYEERVLGTEGFTGAGGTFSDATGQERVRPFGLGSDIGAGGAWGVLAVPPLLALLGTARRRWAGRLGAPLGIGIILAVATSQSRSIVLAAVLGAIVFAALAAASTRRATALGAIAVVLALTVGVTSSLTGGRGNDVTRYSGIGPSDVVGATYDSRQGTLAAIPDYASQFPLGAGLGLVGPATGFGREADSGAALNGESQFTFLLVEVGVAGMLILLALHGRFLMLGLRLRRIEDPELRLLLAGCAASMFALAGLWLSGPITATSPSAPFFWFTGGLLVSWLAGSTMTRQGVAPGHDGR